MKTGTRTIRDFYSFGIYGRDFNMDSDADNDPGAAGIARTSELLFVAIAVIALLRNIM